MLFGLVCHLVVVISHPRVRNRHALIHGCLCLQTNTSLLALRQHHHTFGIGNMTFLQFIASTLDLIDSDFCSRNRMSATLVQHYDFLFILRQGPMNHLQACDVYQHPYFGIPMSVGCSQGVIKSQFQAFKGYRILTHLIVGSGRKVEMLVTNQGAVFTDCLGKRGFSQRRRFHRKVHPIYLQLDARQVGVTRLYPYRTFGINGSQLQLQSRIQNLPFLVLQGIDAVVMRISADSLLKQGQTFFRLQLHPGIGQSKIHLGTHIEVGVLLHPLAELLLVSLRIGIEGGQEPCRTHALSLVQMQQRLVGIADGCPHLFLFHLPLMALPKQDGTTGQEVVKVVIEIESAGLSRLHHRHELIGRIGYQLQAVLQGKIQVLVSLGKVFADKDATENGMQHRLVLNRQVRLLRPCLQAFHIHGHAIGRDASSPLHHREVGLHHLRHVAFGLGLLVYLVGLSYHRFRQVLLPHLLHVLPQLRVCLRLQGYGKHQREGE